VGAGIQPGVAAAHDFDIERTLFQIQAIEVGDFQLAARRRFQAFGQINDLPVVKIKPGHGVAGFGVGGLFFQRQHFAAGLEFGYAIALGVVHVVGEDTGAFGACHRAVQ